MNELRKKFDNYKKSPIIDNLFQYINESNIEELFHIDVYKLADQWGINRKDLLNVFLSGVKYGIFDLSWEFHCPSCGGVAKEVLRLKDSHSEDHCPVCNIDFKNTVDDNIEIFFSINESIKPIPNSIKKAYSDRISHDITKNGKYNWQKETRIKAVDCINNPIFRDLFGEEVLPMDQNLEIKHSTILFTDIKGSTKMYEALGDSKAFSLVREHFDILFNNIQNNNGIAIKTIGDAVMGVFVNDSDCLTAAINSQLELKKFNEQKNDIEKIELKIGIHSGPAIVVTLNNRLDYFGTTVNIAARIQGFAKPDEIVFSKKVFDKKENRILLKQYTDKVIKQIVNLKGLKDNYEIFAIRCRDCKI